MREFELIWTKTAKLDLISILDYVAAEDKEEALKIFSKTEKKLGLLKSFPERGKIVFELEKFNIYKYRELIISPWRIFYKVESEKIFVLSVIDGRRNVEDVLLNRFLK